MLFARNLFNEFSEIRIFYFVEQLFWSSLFLCFPELPPRWSEFGTCFRDNYFGKSCFVFPNLVQFCPCLPRKRAEKGLKCRCPTLAVRSNVLDRFQETYDYISCFRFCAIIDQPFGQFECWLCAFGASSLKDIHDMTGKICHQARIRLFVGG